MSIIFFKINLAVQKDRTTRKLLLKQTLVTFSLALILRACERAMRNDFPIGVNAKGFPQSPIYELWLFVFNPVHRRQNGRASIILPQRDPN